MTISPAKISSKARFALYIARPGLSRKGADGYGGQSAFAQAIPSAFMLTMPASFTPLKTSSSAAGDMSGFKPTIPSAQRWQ